MKRFDSRVVVDVIGWLMLALHIFGSQGGSKGGHGHGGGHGGGHHGAAPPAERQGLLAPDGTEDEESGALRDDEEEEEVDNETGHQRRNNHSNSPLSRDIEMV